MPIKSSGEISLEDIRFEFAGPTPILLNQYYRGGSLNRSGSPNVPTSGAISIGQFYGVGVNFIMAQTIAADTNKYNLVNELTAAGWDGVTTVNATITINSGIVVYSDTTATAAFTVPANIPAGSTINIINNGYIVGMGGAGGGGTVTLPLAGGAAMSIAAACSITNNGTIGGGGGGGGGGVFSLRSYGGGGGRSGRVNSPGGSALTSGYPGTFAAQGIGTAYGGGGGNWGAAGMNGYSKPGAAGGAAVIGNANVTWVATGTRMGALS